MRGTNGAKGGTRLLLCRAPASAASKTASGTSVRFCPASDSALAPRDCRIHNKSVTKITQADAQAAIRGRSARAHPSPAFAPRRAARRRRRPPPRLRQRRSLTARRAAPCPRPPSVTPAQQRRDPQMRLIFASRARFGIKAEDTEHRRCTAALRSVMCAQGTAAARASAPSQGTAGWFSSGSPRAQPSGERSSARAPAGRTGARCC